MNPKGSLFVSYSHADAGWRDRFAVMLAPAVRNLGVELWSDDRLAVGGQWRPELEEAVRGSSVALLLVSADFLASKFIIDEELPALLAAGAMLAPVLVRACMWETEPLLTSRQWTHDPGAMDRSPRPAIGRRASCARASTSSRCSRSRTALLRPDGPPTPRGPTAGGRRRGPASRVPPDDSWTGVRHRGSTADDTRRDGSSSTISKWYQPSQSATSLAASSQR